VYLPLTLPLIILVPDLGKNWSLGCRATSGWKAENSLEILSTGMTKYRRFIDLRFFLSVYFVVFASQVSQVYRSKILFECVLCSVGIL